MRVVARMAYNQNLFQLRSIYKNLKDGGIKDPLQAAELLVPTIGEFEGHQAELMRASTAVEFAVVTLQRMECQTDSRLDNCVNAGIKPGCMRCASINRLKATRLW